jgi:hypothetical protein
MPELGIWAGQGEKGRRGGGVSIIAEKILYCFGENGS